MPPELAAVAFVESGFKNIPDRKTSISSYGEGMWQFIPKTAQLFGLRVDSNKDERFDIPMATDAAMKYIRSNDLQLGDLRLALMGYYFGESRIRADSVKHGTRNPWELAKRANYKTPYLARVMAAAIILKNPQIVL